MVAIELLPATTSGEHARVRILSSEDRMLITNPAPFNFIGVDKLLSSLQYYIFEESFERREIIHSLLIHQPEFKRLSRALILDLRALISSSFASSKS